MLPNYLFGDVIGPEPLLQLTGFFLLGVLIFVVVSGLIALIIVLAIRSKKKKAAASVDVSDVQTPAADINDTANCVAQKPEEPAGNNEEIKEE